MDKQQASPEYKREVLGRLRKAKADRVPIGLIAEACGDGVNIHVLYDILETKRFPLDVWEIVSKGLKKLGY